MKKDEIIVFSLIENSLLSNLIDWNRKKIWKKYIKYWSSNKWIANNKRKKKERQKWRRTATTKVGILKIRIFFWQICSTTTRIFFLKKRKGNTRKINIRIDNQSKNVYIKVWVKQCSPQTVRTPVNWHFIIIYFPL